MNTEQMHEQAYIEMEAARIDSSEQYFSARPQIDNNDRRRVFEAGFDRGWKAALQAKNVPEPAGWLIMSGARVLEANYATEKEAMQTLNILRGMEQFQKESVFAHAYYFAPQPPQSIEAVADMTLCHYEHIVVDTTEESDAGVWPVLVPNGFKVVPAIEADKVRELDSILIEAMKDGYRFFYAEPASYLTDEANKEFAFGVERSKAPFCDNQGTRFWSGPTLFEALDKAKVAIASMNTNGKKE